MCMCIRARDEGGGWGPKTRNPSLNGSVSVCIQAAEGGGGFCGITGTPCCGILDGGLCAVRWYGRRGLCCSPWDLHPFLSPSPPHPFPSFSFSSYFPPRDPWMGWVQSDGPRVWWWMSGGMKNTNANVLIASRSYTDLTPHTLVHLTVLFRDHLKS